MLRGNIPYRYSLNIDRPVQARHGFVVENRSEPFQVNRKLWVLLKTLPSGDRCHRIVWKELPVVLQDEQVISRNAPVRREHQTYIDKLQVPEHLVDEIDIHPNHAVTRERKAIGLLQGTKAVGSLEELGVACEHDALALEHLCREIGDRARLRFQSHIRIAASCTKAR